MLEKEKEKRGQSVSHILVIKKINLIISHILVIKKINLIINEFVLQK